MNSFNYFLPPLFGFTFDERLELVDLTLLDRVGVLFLITGGLLLFELFQVGRLFSLTLGFVLILTLVLELFSGLS
jgi:hypothetical protein